jgi:hypothetical protein
MQKMRILEKTRDVLILQDSVASFWVDSISTLICGSVFIALGQFNVWFGTLFSILGIGLLLGELINIRASSRVHVCCFNKMLGTVSITNHGLKHITKVFPIQDIQSKVITYKGGYLGAMTS